MNARTVLLVAALVAIAGAIYVLEHGKITPYEKFGNEEVKESAAAASTATKEEMLTAADSERIAAKERKYELAPELTGISGYINTPNSTKLENFRGKIVLVDFWTYSCINCIRTLPHLTEWDLKYRDSGLVIVGVHTPEFDFEKKRENVKAAMEKHGIEYAVVQDNDYQTWRAFGNRYWPRKYIIDADGFIRYDHIGEGAYMETERKIQELLQEINESKGSNELSRAEDRTPRHPLTPELYAGYSFALPRSQNVGNDGGLQPDAVADYKLPRQLQPHAIHLSGRWKSNEENLEAVANASITLPFTAAAVNIVADAKNATMEVRINGSPVSEKQKGTDTVIAEDKAIVTVTEPRLYNIIDGEYGSYVLTLSISDGFSFNAFTFG